MQTVLVSVQAFSAPARKISLGTSSQGLWESSHSSVGATNRCHPFHAWNSSHPSPFLHAFLWRVFVPPTLPSFGGLAWATLPRSLRLTLPCVYFRRPACVSQSDGGRGPSRTAAAGGGGGGIGDSVRAGSRVVGFLDASDAASLGDGDVGGIWPIAKVCLFSSGACVDFLGVSVRRPVGVSLCLLHVLSFSSRLASHSPYGLVVCMCMRMRMCFPPCFLGCSKRQRCRDCRLFWQTVLQCHLMPCGAMGRDLRMFPGCVYLPTKYRLTFATLKKYTSYMHKK